MSLDYFPAIFAINKGRHVPGPKLDDYMIREIYDEINAIDSKDFWKRFDVYRQNLINSPPKYTDYGLSDEHYLDGCILSFRNSSAFFFAHSIILS